MLTKKICMIGDFAVGKTSLVSRYVHSTFSEQYLTTVGVKIDSRLLELPSGDQLKLVLWDIAGSSALSSVEFAYLQGAAAYLLVSDSTRNDTLESAISLQGQAESLLGSVPFVVMLNKADLQDRYDLDPELVRTLKSRDWPAFNSSALLGSGVEEAFSSLGQRLAGS